MYISFINSPYQILVCILSFISSFVNEFLGDCFLYFFAYNFFQTSNIFLTPSEVGVNLKDGYNGDISARDAGKIGGQMVKKMIEQAERNMK